MKPIKIIGKIKILLYTLVQYKIKKNLNICHLAKLREVPVELVNCVHVDWDFANFEAENDLLVWTLDQVYLIHNLSEGKHTTTDIII